MNVSIKNYIVILWVMLLTCCVTSPALGSDGTVRIPELSAKMSLGYRSVSTDGTAHRAAPYSLLDSGPTAGFELKYLNPSYRFILLGSYLDDADYLVEADFDFKGLLRIDVESEKFIHNLDNITYNRPDADGDGVPPVLIKFDNRNANDDYSLQIGIDQVNVKAKLPNYPAHLTLGYWRLERTGEKQLRYLNEGQAACTQCHMVSKTQDIDRVTEEFTIGLDTHLGYLNLAVEQLFREFSDRARVPSDSFEDTLYETPHRLSGEYPHDATPDSRLVSTTIKASTSPSGGIVAAAGFTVGQKENLTGSGLGVSPVESETDFRKASADLTLIPNPKLTLNFRYRMLDQDNSTPSQILVSSLDPADVAVRNNIDFTRASYNAKVSYRPVARLTLMGEFERKDIHRSQTGPALDDPFDPFWELPEDENINRYRLSFIARPLGPSKLKLNAWYEYLTSDDPAYGASVEEQQQFFAGVNWTPSLRFGATANVRLCRGVNRNFERSEYSGGVLDRSQQDEDFTVGLWSQLTDALNINLHYGFLRSDISQDVIFGAVPNQVINENAEYRQRVHTATLSAALRVTKNLQALMEARYIQSGAIFDPDFGPQILPVGMVDSSGISSLSELDIVQTGIAFGLEWTLSDGWNCAARFSHDDYEDRNSSDFDGTAQLYMFNLARSW